MLWVDRHRPSKLEDLSYHEEITQRLESLCENPAGMPHLFFYGPAGSGKKTRIAALLRGLFGAGSERLKLDKRTFTTPTRRVVEISLITSNYHVEMCPGDAGLNDRYVVQEVIKEMASNKNVVSVATGSTANSTTKKAIFKVVVLSEVDRLSRPAQAALRRTMEKYASTCRLILCCHNPSKVIEPVRSRCLGIRVAAPTVDQICKVLSVVAKKERLELPEELAANVARESSRNLRRAVLMLEACYVQSRESPGVLSSDQTVPKTDWELYIRQLAVDLTREQSPARLLAAREKLYELLVNCIPATTILKTLANELMQNLDDTLKPQVMEWAAFYEHRIALSNNNKEIFHLEAFCAKYMAMYKRYLNELFA